ncbi:MAG: molybdate ABC transporter substrate-binding protein [Actinomycetota bacterium]
MRWRAVGVVIPALLVVTACGDAGGGGGSGDDRQEITVLAAASLTEAFSDLAASFEEANGGVEVLLSFGPSDGLATQIIEGAPADVFASASPTWADAVEDDGPGLTGRSDFARNRLVVITPTDDPAGISSVEELAEPGVRLILAAEDVPAGTYAREVLTNTGVGEAALANVVSNEDDVKAVVQKVVLGEADAGIVYITDPTGQVEPELRTVEIPRRINVIATYPIGAVTGTPEPDLARSFVELVTGVDGQAVLSSNGFLPP